MADRTVSAKNQAGFSIAALHLIWTVPLALLIGFPLWISARLIWCGFGGCSGPTANYREFDFTWGVVTPLVCAALILVAVAVPPWVRPWWIRWAIALVLALTDAYLFGWGNAPSPIPWLPTIIRGGFDF